MTVPSSVQTPVRFVLTSHVEEHTAQPAAGTYADVFAQVALVERYGFDALWLAEHHFGAQAGRVSQPLLVALAAAGRTTRLKVGTSLIVVPLHHPLQIAEQLATLDILTGGRLSIGFGSGSAPHEFAGFGVPYDGAVRHPRFREALEMLERAWSGEPFSYAGQQFQIPAAQLVPRPERALRDFAWLGAMSKETAAMAGEFGYGLQLPRGLTAEQYAPVLAAYRAALREHWGLDAPERIAIARCLYVGADDATALAEAGPSIAQFYQHSKNYDPSKPVPPAADLVEQLRFIVGGPERCAREIAALQAATGLTHLSIQPVWHGLPQAATMASLRRFGEDIIPRLAEVRQLVADD